MARIALLYHLDRGPATGASIWADARLDNRDELLAALGGGAGDAGLILAAYERWGDDCASHLLGDFAFVIWDHWRRRLYCARDQAGIRQLSYYCDGRVFACASVPEQLLDFTEVQAKPDTRTLANWLLDRFPDPDATLYQGIRRLPAAHSMAVTAAGIRLRRYWDPANLGAARRWSDKDTIEGFRDVFAEAVECRLAGNGDVAATLSGGLDSSAIVCMARHLVPGALSRVYSLVFEQLPCDERPYIEAVARAAGVDLEFCFADDGSGSRPAGTFDPGRFPGTPCDASFSMNLDLLDRAWQHSTRVLLCGVGGDELLSSGDAYLSDFIRHGRLFSAAQAVADRVRHCGISQLRPSGAACARAFVPARLRSAARGLAGPPLPGWIRQDFLREAGALEPTPAPPGRFGCEAQERIYSSLTTGRTAGYTLPGSDAMAAAFGMEFRYPFLDRRLIEYVLRLPPRRAEWFAGKLLLREALRGILPEAVRTRLDKTGFEALVERGLDRENETIRGWLADSELVRLGAIDRKEMERLLDRRGGQAGQASEKDRNELASFLRAEAPMRALRHLQRKRHGKPGRQKRVCEKQGELFDSAPGQVR
jgi:asparagine synthase (glutamine-hydrolysing)